MPHQDDNGPPMFTYAMLAAYIGIFAAQLQGSDSTSYLHAYPWRLAEGHTWRLVTSSMMHGSVIHIAFNAIWFFRFSRVIENWLGPWVALLMYAFFSAGSMAVQVLITSPFQLPAIGASGAVYGLFGFLWVLRRRRDDAAEAVPVSTSQTMLAWLVICAGVNHFGGHIANAAHVAGLAMGWGLGHAVIASKQRKPLIWVGVLVGGLMLPALTFGPVWSATLGQMPWFRKQFNPSYVAPFVREMWEHPPPDWEKALRPRIF